jgi:hypothetical protein
MWSDTGAQIANPTLILISIHYWLSTGALKSFFPLLTWLQARHGGHGLLDRDKAMGRVQGGARNGAGASGEGSDQDASRAAVRAYMVAHAYARTCRCICTCVRAGAYVRASRARREARGGMRGWPLGTRAAHRGP